MSTTSAVLLVAYMAMITMGALLLALWSIDRAREAINDIADLSRRVSRLERHTFPFAFLEEDDDE